MPRDFEAEDFDLDEGIDGDFDDAREIHPLGYRDDGRKYQKLDFGVFMVKRCKGAD